MNMNLDKIICNCQGVTCGRIKEAVDADRKSVV